MGKTYKEMDETKTRWAKQIEKAREFRQEEIKEGLDDIELEASEGDEKEKTVKR